jgi:hypothetical protein
MVVVIFGVIIVDVKGSIPIHLNFVILNKAAASLLGIQCFVCAFVFAIEVSWSFAQQPKACAAAYKALDIAA